MGFQRVRNDLATDHQQTDSMLIVPNVKVAKRVNFEGSHHKKKEVVIMWWGGDISWQYGGYICQY